MTLHALVRDEFQGQIAEDADYYFCDAKGCDVVYFTTDGRTFTKPQLKVAVGIKETELPIQVCYCFDWTTDDIERELRLTGTTTIPDRIKLKVQQGYCQCETTNPQGSCCLGNVNRAVKEVRAKLAAQSGAAVDQPHSNGRGTPDTVPTSTAGGGPRKEKGGVLATAGAAFTAVVASACCWLPLLLIAFGFSAAGVGSFFESYRPYFLTATFALLGVAWYFTYRSAIRSAWVRLRGKPVPLSAGEACCAPEATPPAAHSCCATEPEPDAASQPVRRRFTVRQFNQVMLWVATVVILLFALFPRWSGLLFGGGNRDTTTAVTADDHQQLILELKGMTCEGCAATIEKALRGVPGVSAATVSYEKSQAVVLVPTGREVPRDAILEAVRQAGYEARFAEGTGLGETVYRLGLGGMTCEGCAATVEQALRKVPGVARVEVNYRRAEAVVTARPGSAVQPEALLRAVQDAGYSAELKK